ncbi:MAG: hypothetical protein JNK67_09200 [Alphaproteobacteria bacterium]|nr:hypothetical protein [Alphaproteobacteria bacterium]
MWRRSFQFRLFIGALVWVAGGLVASALILSGLFERHVDEQFDSELSDHSSELERLIVRNADGTLRLTHELSDARFTPPGSGFYWQVAAPGGVDLRSESLQDNDLALRRRADGGVGAGRQILVDGPSGPLALLLREVPAAGGDQKMLVGVGVDRRYRDDVVQHFERTLVVTLVLMALGHTLAAGLQIRIGLRPLDRVRAAIAAVRTGRADRLPGDLPTEIGPLVGELNSLMSANQEIARQGRVQAGNLAHALKNPLSIIMDEAASLGTAGQREAADTLAQQCERMRRHIEYYLAQAQATATRTGRGAATPVDPAIRSIIAALTRLHREKALAFEYAAAGDDVAAACGGEEIHEIFGNLIDNAAKWARGRVRVTASKRDDATLTARVDDDGPGMPEAAREIVFDVGKRLDEQSPGSGLGLAIVREIVDRCGGRVWIETSPLGGTAACVELPLAPSG